MRAYSTVQQLLCYGGYCELILSLARTSCRLLFTARPTARPLAGNPLRDVRSRNPSKSTLAHDAVGTAVLHKHHPIIRVGAGFIQFVYRSHLRLATEATRDRSVFSPFFPRVLLLTYLNLVSYSLGLVHVGLSVLFLDLVLCPLSCSFLLGPGMSEGGEGYLAENGKLCEDRFYYCSERNNVVVLFGTLKVQSFILTEVSDCGLLIVVTSSTFLKRKDMLKGKSS